MIRCANGHAGPWAYAETASRYFGRASVDEDGKRVVFDHGSENGYEVEECRLLCLAAGCDESVVVPGDYTVESGDVR